MAVIHQTKIPGAFEELANIIRGSIAKDMWGWFTQHEDMTVLDLRVFKIIHVKVTVGQLETLFETLFGARNE